MTFNVKSAKKHSHPITGTSYPGLVGTVRSPEG